jgi:ATP-dependent DNA helicase RecQ
VEELQIPIVTAFTATASPLILSKIKKILFPNRSPNIVYGNPDRINISYKVIETISPEQSLIDQVSIAEKPMIIFSSSRTGTELTARLLRGTLQREDIFFYHAGLSKKEKDLIEKWFFDSGEGILVATCAYGMVVDKSNIRTVIHIDLPKTVESYLQESGRAGRDHEPAEAIVIYSKKEHNILKRLEAPLTRERFEQMIRYAEDKSTCRRESLLSMLDSTPEICSGCDICNNDLFHNESEIELLSLLKKNKRRFRKRELVYFLKGYKNTDVRDQQLYRIRGFGLLKEWEPDQIFETVEMLLESGKIRIPKYGFWKNYITM